MTRNFAALGIALLTLAGCETVEFQNPPSAALSQCDQAWVGDWRIEDLRPDQDVVVGQEQFLRVTKDCDRLLLVDIRPGDGEALEIEVNDIEKDQEVGFASSEKHKILALRDIKDPDAQVAKSEQPEGFVLLRYELDDKKKLVIREADRKSAARLVVDGVTPGWVEKHDRRADGSQGAYASHFWVFLFGTAEETRALLDAQELFTTDTARLAPLSTTDSARLTAAIAEERRRSDAAAEKEKLP